MCWGTFMIAISVRERAARRSKGEDVVTLARPTGNTGVCAAAVRVLSDSSAERRAMIAEAAYYIAERRGFEAGHEFEDWLCAEREISGKLA